ncbi:MAG: Crp/Fnr family transcriptional regulator [Clostridiales bacterium]|nr:Crp/Fnr family transcriptional regulator [Clostridiales bacterium]
MENIYALAKRSPLFSGMDEDAFERLYTCLRCRLVKSCKGEVLLRQGDEVRDAGILLSGEAQPVSVSLNGALSAMPRLKAGDVFGGVLMSAENAASPVHITALSDLTVLYLPVGGIMQGCPRVCAPHDLLRLNLLRVISEKFLQQNRQLQYVKLKSVREKILLFLSDARRAAGANTFSIDYDRETLAALLAVNRSALSRELGRMRDEGLLSFYKNSFKIF